MQVLLSSIGSRGDVQPILALGLELRALGHRARLCVAPNFKDWIESYGLECQPIGPDLKKLTGGSVPGKPVLPSREQLREMAEQSVRDQFRVIAEAAHGCDLIVAGGALQVATRSDADSQKIPYVFAAYCPGILPSRQYPPPKIGGHHSFELTEAENLELWVKNAREFALFSATLNEERAKIGFGPVEGVRDHIFTKRPWLAADPCFFRQSKAASMTVTVSSSKARLDLARTITCRPWRLTTRKRANWRGSLSLAIEPSACPRRIARAKASSTA